VEQKLEQFRKMSQAHKRVDALFLNQQVPAELHPCMTSRDDKASPGSRDGGIEELHVTFLARFLTFARRLLADSTITVRREAERRHEEPRAIELEVGRFSRTNGSSVVIEVLQAT
jgi:hypothetical protein